MTGASPLAETVEEDFAETFEEFSTTTSMSFLRGKLRLLLAETVEFIPTIGSHARGTLPSVGLIHTSPYTLNSTIVPTEPTQYGFKVCVPSCYEEPMRVNEGVSVCGVRVLFFLCQQIG